MRLSVPYAIILGYALLGIALVICAFFIGESIWTVLTAFGTIGAVAVALFIHVFQEWIKRPILEIDVFESQPPHLRRVVTGSDRDIVVYPLHLQIRNNGTAVAKKAQPLLSGMGRLIDGKWVTQNDWIPVSLIWALDELVRRATGKPTEERDLVPRRPYVFSVGFLATNVPESFCLDGEVLRPLNQPGEYGPGEFCFEIAVFAEGATPVKKYIHIQWQGGCNKKFEEVKSRIQVNLKDRPPWKVT
jgi:hypothetical protein